MSLLMDALKQAGDKKKQPEDTAQPDHTLADSTDPNIADAPSVAVEAIETADTASVDTALSLSPADPQVEDDTLSLDFIEDEVTSPDVEIPVAPTSPATTPQSEPPMETPVEQPDATDDVQPTIDIDAEHQHFDKNEVAQRIANVNKLRQQRQRKRVLHNGIALTVTLLIAIGSYYLWASLAHTEPNVFLQPLPPSDTASMTTLQSDTADAITTQSTPIVAPDQSNSDTAVTWMEQQLSQPIQPETVRVIEPTAEVIAEPVSATPTAISIRRTTSSKPVKTWVTEAYQQYQRGDFEAARRQYQKVLQDNPRHHDALLAMAAIALQQNKIEEAKQFYRKTLDFFPDDSQALTALGSLSNITSQLTESQLKNLLTTQPNSAHLHFALANAYASQARWVEAQLAYFEAQRLAPAQPDYAFNLAISLEHISKPSMAKDYYERALSLASQTPAKFDNAIAHARIAALGVTPQ